MSARTQQPGLQRWRQRHEPNPLQQAVEHLRECNDTRKLFAKQQKALGERGFNIDVSPIYPLKQQTLGMSVTRETGNG